MPFPGGTYTTLNPAGGGEDSTFGGIVPLADDAIENSPYWLPYFEVADAEATVTKARDLGAEVRMPATSFEGVGSIAKLTDPYGARFAVIRSASPQERD